MHTSIRHRIFLTGLMAQLLILAGFGQAQTPAPAEFTKGQLETEQRIMKANISDANYHIDRAIKSVGANLADSAKVSLLRATGRVAQIDEVMKAHPERIERLAFSLFYSRETVRAELRASYKKLRDEFGAVEDAMYALRGDMLRKGLFGDELKQQIAVLDAATKLLPEIEKTNPELAAKVRTLIEQINQALASGDTAKAEELIKQLNGLLEGAGYKQNIADAKSKIGGGAGGGGAATVMGAHGQPVAIPGATATGGGKARLADGTEVDLNGAQVLPDGSIRLADGRVIKDGRLVSGSSGPVVPGKDAKFYDADGNEITVDATWGPDGAGAGVDKVYVGGRGERLVRETKVTFKPVPISDKPNAYTVAKTPGESRTWAFIVGPVPGSDKKASGSYTVAVALTDKSGASGFTASRWEITGPGGSPSLDNTSGPQVTATFSQSGTYSVQVSGTTDWGSPFVIKSSLKIGVD
jgi:hypothetical protein